MKFTKLISDGHLKPRKVWEQLCRVVFFRAYSKKRSFVSVSSPSTVFAWQNHLQATLLGELQLLTHLLLFKVNVEIIYLSF